MSSLRRWFRSDSSVTSSTATSPSSSWDVTASRITGSSGPTGLYLGLSGLAAYHTTDETPWFATFGAAADVGIAAFINGSYHIAIGGGIQLTRADIDNDALKGAGGSTHE